MVTVSGTTGSGKSTAARYVQQLLRQDGRSVAYLRFRFLPCFGLRASSSRHSGSTAPSGSRERDGANRARSLVSPPAKPLDALALVGYASRVIAFRVYWMWNYRSASAVVDRYFFDNLANRRLTSWRERLYLKVLAWIVPTPDLSILMVADAVTVVERRPHLTVDRVRSLHRAYQLVAETFPGIVTVSGDGREDATRERLSRLIADRRRPRDAAERSPALRR